MRMRRASAGRVGLAGALAASALVLVPQASYAAHRTIPLAVVARDFQFLGLPPALPAGQYDVRFFNLGQEPHVIVAVNLGPQCSQSITTKEQGLAFLQTVDSDAAFAAACPGGSFAGDVFAPPGGRSTGPLTLAPGRTMYFCPIPEENGVPHFDLGMIGFIDVFSLPGGFSL